MRDGFVTSFTPDSSKYHGICCRWQTNFTAPSGRSSYEGGATHGSYGEGRHHSGNRVRRRLPRPRGLDRALFHKLANSEWIDAYDNLILCGPTGVGKSWLACALGHKACRDNRSVLYQRVPKLFADLALARGDGRHARIMRTLTGAQLLILDDWGLDPLDAGARRDLYEILEERYGRRSTILTSQVPVDKWHEVIGNPTYADAILDRLVHNAHRIDLVGDSLRRTRPRPTAKD